MPYPEQVYLEIFGKLYPELARQRAEPSPAPGGPPPPPSSGLGWPGGQDQAD
jgi:hypothetical protein